MKKCLVVLTAMVALVLLAPMANASTLCGAAGAGGAGNVALIGQPVTMSCPTFVVPAGEYLSSIDVTLVDDAQGPAGAGSYVSWVWTAVSGFPTAVNGTTQTNTETSTSGFTFNSCTGVGISTTCGPTDLIFSESLGSGNTFNAVVMTVSALPSTPPELLSNGGDSAEMYITPTFSSNAPEPVTLSLMGGALLGLALFGKKLSRR